MSDGKPVNLKPLVSKSHVCSLPISMSRPNNVFTEKDDAEITEGVIN